MHSGNTAAAALNALMEAGWSTHNPPHCIAGVAQERVYLLTLFCTPRAVITITEKFPRLTVLTTEITDSIPLNFGMKYFGTD